MTFYNKFILLFFTGFLIACGGSSNNTQSTVKTVNNVPEFAVAKDNGITTSSSSVSGSGSIVFAKPLEDDGANFKIQFGLVDENSSISLLFYSNSKLNESGAVVIKIQKKNGKLTGTLKISGSNTIDLGIDSLSDTENTLYMDIHNDEEPTHVLVWLNGTTIFTETSSVFNSEDSDEISTLGQKVGTDFFVGVILENASLMSFEINEPRFED